MKPVLIPPALRWACRRGMLELDVLLGNFLEEVYPQLAPDDQSLFAKLLDDNDQNLFLWLTGKEQCADLELAQIVQKIRYHAEHRHSS